MTECSVWVSYTIIRKLKQPRIQFGNPVTINGKASRLSIQMLSKLITREPNRQSIQFWITYTITRKPNQLNIQTRVFYTKTGKPNRPNFQNLDILFNYQKTRIGWWFKSEYLMPLPENQIDWVFSLDILCNFQKTEWIWVYLYKYQ